MKSEITTKPDAEQTYPYLGIYTQVEETQFIVLFTEPCHGTVVWTGITDRKLGESSFEDGSEWVEKMFKPFTGKIELSN